MWTTLSPELAATEGGECPDATCINTHRPRFQGLAVENARR